MSFDVEEAKCEGYSIAEKQAKQRMKALQEFAED